MNHNVFPLGLAIGPAFCNRVNERQSLNAKIKQGTHVVLLAPRRYGKSSLVLQVLSELKWSYCKIDFLLPIKI